ncbi:general transcription factor IIH subunit 4 [Pelomyxa schiedti]|nr:general transcription factor IIH subunit 4 [Pelomyxa schiedti]
MSGGSGTASVFDFLSTMTTEEVSALYQRSPWGCLAVLRSLPPLARQYASRVTFVPGFCIPASSMLKWAISSTSSAHDAAVAALVGKKILVARDSTGGKMYYTNIQFQTQMREFMLSGLNPKWADEEVPEDENEAPLPEELDQALSLRWDRLVLSMVPGEPVVYSPVMGELLAQAGLVQKPQMAITNAGFQFLLQDSHTQIWTLLLALIRSYNSVEALCFLFKLGFQKFGKGYSSASLTDAQNSILYQLRELGLVYIPGDHSQVYYPTRIAISLCSTSDEPTTATQEKGFVVVETSYRIYAYTNSRLHLALLKLFSQVMCRLPNVIIALITSKSIHRALVRGITANQIITFLHQNAHPEARKQTPWVPETVADQIRLWEADRNRVTLQASVQVVFHQDGNYFRTKEKATEENVLHWFSDEHMTLVVAESAYDMIKTFIQSL